MKSSIGKTLIIASVLTIFDQLIKAYALKNFASGVSVIGNSFTLTVSKNPGIAFGMELPKILLIILTIALLFVLIYIATKELNLKMALTQTSLALIIGGGLGNLIDRFNQGYVTDFISIWKWPTFNFADIYIVVGVLLIIVFYGRIKRV